MNAKEKALEYYKKNVHADDFEVEEKMLDIAIKEAKKEVFDDLEYILDMPKYKKLTTIKEQWWYKKLKKKHLEDKQ